MAEILHVQVKTHSYNYSVKGFSYALTV